MSPPLKRNYSQFQSSSTANGSKRNGKKSIRLALATVPSTTMTAQDEVSDGFDEVIGKFGDILHRTLTTRLDSCFLLTPINRL
jgi:hypothetical protein